MVNDDGKSIQAFLTAARGCGWNIETDVRGSMELPEAITQRYTRIPESYHGFLSEVSLCRNGNERAWFQCVSDFRLTDENGWLWDQIERLELEAACDDEHREEIREHWDGQIPIAFNAEYSCLSLSVRDDDFGAVYYSFLHYWDEPSRIADSLEDYLERMTAFLDGSSSVKYKDDDGEDCVILEFFDFM